MIFVILKKLKFKINIKDKKILFYFNKFNSNIINVNYINFIRVQKLELCG